MCSSSPGVGFLVRVSSCLSGEDLGSYCFSFLWGSLNIGLVGSTLVTFIICICCFIF